ncbi:CHAT domain-containing protein [Saccharothrix obliqua]|uniref:CHAT domain-containing protein n=1 Tax=Saccharothrix obliqua TaxID=2861747 RepID=UPI001C5DB93D|nr:CHAT domain-containing protein [Saccharothrix obliqua]MBW4722160.1 CHAT domain-containing protein [Saccharothrix obliqua]
MSAERGPVRQRLLARLRAGSPDALLDPDAENEAAALLKIEVRGVLSGDPDGPAYCMEAFAVLGWLFWNRYLAAKDERSLMLAMLVFTPLAADGSLVPEPVLGQLPRTASGGHAVEAWNDMVGDVVIAGIGPDDRTALLAGAAVLVMGLGMSPPGSDVRWRFQDNLIHLLCSLHEAHHDPEALTEALDLARWSVDRATPATRVRSLRRLVETLVLAHNATGDASSLHEAVGHARAAVAASPGAEELVDVTNILAGLLISRHGATSDTGALDEAVTLLRGLLDNLPTTHPAHAATTGHLAVALGHRTQENPEPGRIAELCRSCLDGIPADHPVRPRVLATLTDDLIRLARRTGSPRDVDAAVATARQAAAEVPPGKRMPGQVARTLATALVARHELLGDPSSFDEAVAHLDRGAQEATDEVERANMRFTLAALWNNRYADTRDRKYAHTAVAALRAAMACPGGTVRQRVRMAVSAAEILGDLDDHGAADLMVTAIGSLSDLAGRHLSTEDRQSALREFRTAPVRAASYAIAAGRPELALELLERGRGVLFAESTAVRDGIPALAGRAPGPAADLARVTAELAGATDSDSRHRLDRERQRLVEDIRELPGFEDFLKPPRLPEILEACRSGPVVVPLAARGRLDALIVTTEGVRHVPLPPVDLDTLRSRTRQLVEADDEDLLDGLEWLWEVITGPVLTALGLTGPPPEGRRPPVVRWCPTGLLSHLPLHAAGVRGGPQALDRAVFSYTTSIRALRRTRPWRTHPDPAPLVVGLSRTPGLPDLPGVDQELALLAGLFPRSRILRNAAATRERVMAALASHDMVHFACHGGSNPAERHQGQLFLHDGPLGLADLAGLHVPRGTLAYLSACTTARQGLDLPDEALSIASGFQLAGFGDVVASLWSLGDGPALRATSDFYTELRSDNTAAHAVHHMMRKRRQSEPPSSWAPYIHMGA